MVKTKPVYAIATNITSAMGLDTPAHWAAVASGKPGICRHEDAAYSDVPFWGSRLAPGQWQLIQANVKTGRPLSPFEQLAVFSAKSALQNADHDLAPADTIIILSTTKGNIEWLNREPDERLLLHTSAGIIAAALGYTANKPLVISQACVSGVLSLTYGLRLLQSGRYKHAIVIGCDRFSQFVLKGFQSFRAIADAPCRPFDAARKGINLGEAGATIILSTTPGYMPLAKLMAGAATNDANHISGPSRTGGELAIAIHNTLHAGGITAQQVDMVSAHGTATIYNDEMEAKALALCELSATPMHSLKGYTGHTLGTAGVLESAMIIHSVQQQQLIPSANFETSGVSVPVNITTKMQPATIRYVLKTASGFGGSNAAALWGGVE